MKPYRLIKSHSLQPYVYTEKGILAVNVAISRSYQSVVQDSSDKWLPLLSFK